METSTAAPTVRVVEPLIEPRLAVMRVDPWARVVACPWVPPPLPIVAIDGFELPHVTVPVMSCVVVSL